MKQILCYGDSNTRGQRPDLTQARWEYQIRWPGRLQQLLGEEYLIIEAGFNGRTTVFEDPEKPYRNGRDFLPAFLETHKPLDLVIIMLGTNDTKVFFNADAEKIGAGMENLVEIVQKSECGPDYQRPEILIVAPAHILEGIEKLEQFQPAFSTDAPEISRNLAAIYEKLAGKKGCYFLDAAVFIESSKADCLHLGSESHEKLADVLSDKVKEIFAR